jgi:hypothetical protein
MNERSLPPEHAWYLYGVATQSTFAPPACATDVIGGIAPRYPVVALPCAEFVAFVSAVPLAEFAPEQLRARAQDVVWLERVVREHERVVDALHRRSTTAPARFCTIVMDADAVRASLADNRGQLLSTLRRLTDCDEFEVQVAAERAPFEEHVAHADPRILELRTTRAASSPGKAYLLDRQIAKLLERSVGEAVGQLAGSIFADLSALSVEGQVLPRVRDSSAAPARLPILHAAFLVERSRQPELLEALERVAPGHAGIQVGCSGARPPYDFIESAASAANEPVHGATR